jgi:ABC-type multidrug transport system ATPase subunit
MDEAYELCDRIGIMQKGEFIVLGTPDELLSTYFDEMVVELPIAQGLKEVLETIKEIDDLDKGEKNFIFSTKDLNSVLKQLSQKDIDLTKMKIRQSDLEDLFIHLTHQKGQP